MLCSGLFIITPFPFQANDQVQPKTVPRGVVLRKVLTKRSNLRDWGVNRGVSESFYKSPPCPGGVGGGGGEVSELALTHAVSLPLSS